MVVTQYFLLLPLMAVAGRPHKEQTLQIEMDLLEVLAVAEVDFLVVGQGALEIPQALRHLKETMVDLGQRLHHIMVVVVEVVLLP